MKELALAVDQRLEEVDRVAVMIGKVGAALYGEEVVPTRMVNS